MTARAALAGLLMLASLGACHPAETAAASTPREGQEEAPDSIRLLGATLELAAEDREAMGIEFARLEPTSHGRELRAFGRVVSDPGAVSTLRAPLAGELVPGEVVPALGQPLSAGTVVFRLVPRWTPQERADLAAREAAARAEVAAAEVELPALRQALARARALNAQEKAVSDRELEETEARLHAAEARQLGARDVLQTLEEVARGQPGEPLALRLSGAGEVVELGARAGDTLEAGALLLRVEDHRTLLVELDLPDGIRDPSAVRAVRLELGRDPPVFVTARSLGLAPGTGTAGLFPALLVRVEGAEGAALRPGRRVSAWIPSDEPAREGLILPRAAVVRLAGQAFAYVKREGERIERLAVSLQEPLPGGWFVERSWSGEASPEVIVRGAQNVLSSELLGHQGEEEE